MPEIKEREMLYKGKLVQVERLSVEQEDGQQRTREVVRHGAGVAIVVLKEHGEAPGTGQELLMIKQYRAPIGEEVLELVAGLVDEGESPLEAARRELREETGVEAAEWIELGTLLSSPGFTDERITLFIARQLQHVGDDLDPGEKLSLCPMPFTLALDQIRTGQIQDAKTVAGLLWASLFLESES